MPEIICCSHILWQIKWCNGLFGKFVFKGRWSGAQCVLCLCGLSFNDCRNGCWWHQPSSHLQSNLGYRALICNHIVEGVNYNFTMDPLEILLRHLNSDWSWLHLQFSFDLRDLDLVRCGLPLPFEAMHIYEPILHKYDAVLSSDIELSYELWSVKEVFS